MPEETYGGGYLASEPGLFLAMEGRVGDASVEAKMSEAAHFWLDAPMHEYVGKPKWMPGHRKVTQNEHDDQMERLQDGQIPDWEEEMRLAVKRENR